MDNGAEGLPFAPLSFFLSLHTREALSTILYKSLRPHWDPKRDEH